MNGLLKMKEKRIFVAGHQGMVGSALVRKLAQNSENIIITANRDELNLTIQSEVNNFFQRNSIDQVYLAAAKVGGIHANNSYPAEFIYENLMIEANVIHAAHINDVLKLLFLGSSCIYPKFASQPIQEDALLTGTLEQTNEPYAMAKIAGIKLCESYNRQHARDYRSVMPTNLYGENDNFHAENSHVIPALMRRFHDAKEQNDKQVWIWGTGKPKREFLYVDDLANAVIFVMNLDQSIYEKVTKSMLSHINVGSGQEFTIRDLAMILAKVVGFQGKVCFDPKKPDGAQRKLLDTSKLVELGWEPQVSLEEGLDRTYQWFVEQKNNVRQFSNGRLY